MDKNIFDLERQQEHVDYKIVVALERISESFRVLLWEEAKKFGLSPIQIQLLIFINFHRQEQCKVGYLSREFNMTKATISDSVRILLKKELIEKQTDENDSRSYSISLTAQGRQIASEASKFAYPLLQTLSNRDQREKEKLLHQLLDTIHLLTKSGVISIQRMCQTCRYFLSNENGHFCQFLAKSLKPNDLRIDCPEHEQKA